MSEEVDRSAALIERLLGEPELRRRFLSDPASVLSEHGLTELATGLGHGQRALMTLELRESRSSLAGVMVAAAAEAVDFAHVAERATPGLMHDAMRAVETMNAKPRPKPHPDAAVHAAGATASAPAQPKGELRGLAKPPAPPPAAVPAPASSLPVTNSSQVPGAAVPAAAAPATPATPGPTAPAAPAPSTVPGSGHLGSERAAEGPSTPGTRPSPRSTG